MTKPFIKWVGGKRRLLRRLCELLPETYNKSFEPMVGGGAFFFGQECNPYRDYTLADLNEELITAYRSVRDQPEALIRCLEQFKADYELFPDKREYYNDVRSELVTEDLSVAARFIFLNKTGFNGLYRVNLSGGFNVPWGKREKFNFDPDNIRLCSTALQDVVLKCGDYVEALTEANEGDFIYIDPPYIPISPTSKFTEYQPGGFGLEEQERLAQTFRDLDARGIKVMLSNSHSPLVGRLYEGYDIQAVYTVHSVAAERSARGRIAEVVIRNY
jgi:DNA adenine methylase